MYNFFGKRKLEHLERHLEIWKEKRALSNSIKFFRMNSLKSFLCLLNGHLDILEKGKICILMVRFPGPSCFCSDGQRWCLWLQEALSLAFGYGRHWGGVSDYVRNWSGASDYKRHWGGVSGYGSVSGYRRVLEISDLPLAGRSLAQLLL